MDSIQLHVFLAAGSRISEQMISACPSVQGVELIVSPVSETLPAIPRDMDAVIISDDQTLLKPYIGGDFPLLHLVFLSDEKEFPDIPVNMDIWPLDESYKLRVHRISQLLANIGSAFSAWLYHNFLMTTIDAFPDMIWYKSADGLHWLVNRKFEETVHKTRAQIHGMGHNYIWDVPPEDCGKSEFRCLESEKEVMEKRKTCVSDEHVKMAEGMRHLLTYKTPLYDRLGNVMGTTGMGHDVTDLNNAGLEIRILIENLPFPILMCDDKFHPMQINGKFVHEFEMEKTEVRALDYLTWKETLFTPVTERTYSEENHAYSQEVSAQIDGKTAIYSILEQEIRDYFGNISGYYCLFQNVTIEREYEKMILTYANTDALTKLYNRRYFFEYLRSHAEEPITVLFMDMDNFKLVNDTLGHAAGDTVLCTASGNIESAFSDALVARLGGDEFAAAILGDVDESAILERANALQKTIEDAFAYMNLNISISIGIAKSAGNLTDVDAFLNESDEKMYLNKQQKKRSQRK